MSVTASGVMPPWGPTRLVMSATVNVAGSTAPLNVTLIADTDGADGVARPACTRSGRVRRVVRDGEAPVGGDRGQVLEHRHLFARVVEGSAGQIEQVAGDVGPGERAGEPVGHDVHAAERDRVHVVAAPLGVGHNGL